LIAYDTNVLIYASQMGDEDLRHDIALNLMDRVASVGAIVPLQVIGEYINACRAKGVLSSAAIAQRVNYWLMLYESPGTLPEDYMPALEMADRFKLQFFDALIVTVAARAGASVLLSEDMQDGLHTATLRILNPFNPANQSEINQLLG
jgi:predicted nucleic acid-binding protein